MSGSLVEREPNESYLIQGGTTLCVVPKSNVLLRAQLSIFFNVVKFIKNILVNCNFQKLLKSIRRIISNVPLLYSKHVLCLQNTDEIN